MLSNCGTCFAPLEDSITLSKCESLEIAGIFLGSLEQCHSQLMWPQRRGKPLIGYRHPSSSTLFFCYLLHRHLWLNSIHSLSDKQMVSGTICRIFIIKSFCEMYFLNSLRPWDLIVHLWLRLSWHAIRMNSWQPTTFWSTMVILKTCDLIAKHLQHVYVSGPLSCYETYVACRAYLVFVFLHRLFALLVYIFPFCTSSMLTIFTSDLSGSKRIGNLIFEYRDGSGWWKDAHCWLGCAGAQFINPVFWHS